MKKLFPEAPDVPQSIANGAVRIIERHFKMHGATRARDLPEEARVRLMRDLRQFFDDSGGGRKRRAGVFERIYAWLTDLLS